MKIYVDVLLFINVIINYAILLTAQRLLKQQVRLYRIILGAVCGAAFSLCIFIDINGFWFDLAVKLVSTFVITLVTFGYKRTKEFFKALLLTLFVSVVYSGGYILFYRLFKPPNMVIIKNVLYLELNPILLLILTAVIYFIIVLLQKLFSERIKSTVVPLSFTVLGKKYTCIGKIDTGCNLVEPFSKSAVIIVDKTVFEIGENEAKRVIPYSTVGGSSLLFAVKAESVNVDGREIEESIYLASTDRLTESYQAIINSNILGD